MHHQTNSSANLINEKALIKGCIDENYIYQKQLYKIYAAQMMGLCLRYARCKEDAEDILQEGFLQAFKCISQFKFKGTLSAWLKKIFINCALQKLRKENKNCFIDIEQSTEAYKIAYAATDEIDLKLLLKCIQNLPLMSRLVFNLYVFEGLQHKEIAAMLNISEGTSKSNLFDARTILKKQLKKYDLLLIKTKVNG